MMQTKTLFTVLVLASAASAFELLPCFPSCPTVVFSGIPWVLIAVVAVAAAFAAAAIAYMVARTLSSPQLLAWSKNEIYQVTATLLIVVFLLAAETIESDVLKSFGYALTPEEPNPAIGGALAYLKHVCLYSTESFIALTNFHTIFQATFFSLAKTKFDVFGVVTFSGENIGKKFTYTTRSTFSVAETPLLITIIVTTVQQILLCLTKGIAFHLLLPLGIVLRALPFLRKTGSTIIAIAIGFYLIFPLTFLLNDRIVSYFWFKEGKCPDAEKCEWWTEGHSSLIKTMIGAGVAVTTGIVSQKVVAYMASKQQEYLATYGTGMQLSTFQKFISGSGGAFLSLSILVPLLIGLQGTLSEFVSQVGFIFMIFGAFLPLLNIVITAGVTREIAKIMGSDVDLTSILKVL